MLRSKEMERPTRQRFSSRVGWTVTGAVVAALVVAISGNRLLPGRTAASIQVWSEEDASRLKRIEAQIAELNN